MKTLKYFTLLAFLTTQFIAFSQVTFEAVYADPQTYEHINNASIGG